MRPTTLPLLCVFACAYLAGFSQEKMQVCDDGSLFDLSQYSSLKYEAPASPMACTSGSNLVTFYATNNAQRGHMFDITANNCVTINCFEMNFSTGTSNVDIYTKTGTHVGFENNAAAWTLIGSASNVASAGANLPTVIPINVNQLIATGATRAFYITRTTASGPTVAYTNGTAVGNTLASDANIILKEGTGKEYLFSTNFTPRQFNGRVFYTVNPPCVLPIQLIKFNASSKGKAVDLEWVTATEKNNSHFVIERSKDGKKFEEIGTVAGAGNSSVEKEYSEKDEKPLNGVSYYRLKQVDYNGKFSYSDMRTVKIDRGNLGHVEISPMPVLDQLRIEFDSRSGSEYTLEIFDITGKKVHSGNFTADSELTSATIELSNLEKGMYFINLCGETENNRVKFIKE